MQHAVFVGPDKAGSTWLHAVASAHPAIATSRVKDLFYFDRYHSRGTRWYERQFSTSAETVVTLDVGHDYLFSSTAPSRIHAFDSATIIVVGLREPLDRARSAYRYMLSQGRVAVGFAEAIRTVPELLEHGAYGSLVERWTQTFPRSSFRFLDFSKLRTDSGGVWREICGWFGVDPDRVDVEAFGVVNPARRARSPQLVRLGRQAGSLLRAARLGALVQRAKESQSLQGALFSDDAGEVEPLPPHVEAWVTCAIQKDAEIFARVTGENLPWV